MPLGIKFKDKKVWKKNNKFDDYADRTAERNDPVRARVRKGKGVGLGMTQE